jgi:hypothetical protein
MELTFECSDCGTVRRVSALESSSEALCRKCGRARPLREAAAERGELVFCPICGTDELYVQKDFPQGLGLTIVIVGFAASTYFWYLDQPIPALGILLVSALADMALFHLVPNVTICYRCLSQVRGDGSNSSHRYKPFDLAVGERYRQERLRVEQLRADGRMRAAQAGAESESPSLPDV